MISVNRKRLFLASFAAAPLFLFSQIAAAQPAQYAAPVPAGEASIPESQSAASQPVAQAPAHAMPIAAAQAMGQVLNKAPEKAAVSADDPNVIGRESQSWVMEKRLLERDLARQTLLKSARDLKKERAGSEGDGGGHGGLPPLPNIIATPAVQEKPPLAITPPAIKEPLLNAAVVATMRPETGPPILVLLVGGQQIKFSPGDSLPGEMTLMDVDSDKIVVRLKGDKKVTVIPIKAS